MTATTAAAAPKMQLLEDFPDEGFTGIVPIFYAHTGVLKGKNYSMFKLLSSDCLNSEKQSFENALNDGRIGSVAYEKGVVKAIFIFDSWLKAFSEKDAKNFILCQSANKFRHLDKEIQIISLPVNKYRNMMLTIAPLLGIQIASKA